MSEGLIKCYDRFTFDKIFKILLTEDFSHEDALDFILTHCSLSSLIFQERIENQSYKNILVSKEQEDLLQLRDDIFNELASKN